MSDEQTAPETTESTATDGVQQIPAQIQVQVVQPPATTEARDALLAAIGAEAQNVAEKSAGQASAALLDLARAYAVVTGVETAPVNAGLAIAGRSSEWLKLNGGLKQIAFDGDTIVGVNEPDDIYMATKS